jgi:hypothetical protein
MMGEAINVSMIDIGRQTELWRNRSVAHRPKVPALCVRSALTYVRNLFLQEQSHGCGWLGDLLSECSSLYSALQYSETIIVSSLVIKHRLEFEDNGLSIEPALYGETLNVEPMWGEGGDKRQTLIHILYLLSNMVKRRATPNSSLITSAFVSAIECFDAIGLECRACYLIKTSSGMLQIKTATLS